MSTQRKVLIVGAGPAGLTAAVALRRKGIACELVEITRTGEPLGAALTISGRAVEAMGEIGVLDRLKAVEGEAANHLRGGPYDVDGRIIPGAMAGPGPRAAVGMYRPVLSQILMDEAQAAGAQIRFSTTVEALRQTAQGVEATLSDGAVGDYDLVVGADGIRSRVRALVFGEALQPIYAGQCIIRWMAPGPRIDGPAGSYYTPLGKMIGYPLPKQNLSYVGVVLAQGENRFVSSDEAREILARYLDQFTAPYPRELRRRLTEDQEVLYRPFEWLMVPPPWHRGRVLLIGDAAHATTAHMASGGGMAVEDAVVLAQELDRAATVDEALEAFMARRIERVRAVVETSLGLSKLEEEGATPQQAAAYSAPAFEILAQPY